MATIGVAAPHLVQTLYGSQWSGMVVPLQVLCGAGYFRALYHLGGAVAQGVGRVYNELWRQMVYGGLVIVGALVGASYGLPGVAVGVGAAILYMFVASAQLALHTTGTSWASYFRVQLSALTTAAVTFGIAVSVRMSLEAYQVSSVVITLAILTAVALPWAVGLLWNLGEPGFEPACARLPAGCARLVDALRASRLMWARTLDS
jgi:O-antigen/teichoic acid export membrane protein